MQGTECITSAERESEGRVGMRVHARGISNLADRACTLTQHGFANPRKRARKGQAEPRTPDAMLKDPPAQPCTWTWVRTEGRIARVSWDSRVEMVIGHSGFEPREPLVWLFGVCVLGYAWRTTSEPASGACMHVHATASPAPASARREVRDQPRRFSRKRLVGE